MVWLYISWVYLLLSLSVLGICDSLISSRLPAISLPSSGKGAAAVAAPRSSAYHMSASVQTVAKKPYDLILWGATGFTGSLCARYLSDNYSEKLKIAIAGRSEDKLKALNVENVGVYIHIKDFIITLFAWNDF